MKKRNHIVKAYHVECKRDVDNGKMQIEAHGRTSKGGQVQTTIKCEWYFIPYIIEEMRKAWNGERTRRINQINSIDESLPKS